VRTFALHDGADALEARPNFTRKAEVGQEFFALKPGDANSLDGESCGRHAFHFHSAFCADKQDAGLGVAGLDFTGDADGGKDVSAGSAA
jgi:hypothetical protein